jgi:hypothetical protein
MVFVEIFVPDKKFLEPTSTQTGKYFTENARRPLGAVSTHTLFLCKMKVAAKTARLESTKV